MNGPDGPEEREQWRQERYERDRDREDIEEQLADELHDCLIDIARTAGGI